MILGYKEALDAIKKIFVSGNYSYSNYIFDQLKKEDTLSFINEIIQKSNKTPTEAILVLLAAIRYYLKDSYALEMLHKNNSFQDLLKDHHNEILEISINKKVQSNGPERGLPILDVFGKKLPDKSICVIELGASFGLIGSCLLNYNKIIENQGSYFQVLQKMPENPKLIDWYVGIDIDPPEREWLIPCFIDPKDAERVNIYINTYQSDNSFKIINTSALGFSKLAEIKELLKLNYKIVILTSFMLYQLDEDQQKNLKDEILTFIHNNNGHWICQEVYLLNGQNNAEFYIDWDGERIIKLQDDKCQDWKWLK